MNTGKDTDMGTADQVIAARAGDERAFTALVESHQNLALGYAFSKLGDFHRAQDVAQESFLIAYEQLDRLEDPEMFSGWLRSIVHHRCHRVFRMNLKRWVPFEAELERGSHWESNAELPPSSVQKSQEGALLRKAILELPEQHRTVVSLYYLQEESQKAVAEFLGIPVTKVNNYLSEARQTLKGRLIAMAEDTFRDQRLSEEFAKNIGEIVGITGPVVETKVNKSHRTTVFDVLGSKTRANNPGSDLIVVQRMKDGRFRCISTGDSVANKAKLYSSGNYEKALQELKEEQIVKATQSIQSGTKGEVIETGIKIIDLLTPIRAGASIGIFGREGVGRMVQVMELMYRRKYIKGDLGLFFYVDRWQALGTQDVLETDPYFASDINDNIQTAWIIHDKAGDPTYAKNADYLDVRLYFSPVKAIQGIWPAMDPLLSQSSTLDKDLIPAEHYETATEALSLLQETHDLLLDPLHLECIALGARDKARLRRDEQIKARLAGGGEESKTIKRGLLLEYFFTQPFFVAEEHNGIKGIHVTLDDTIASCRKILDGQFDDREFKDVSWRGKL